VAPEDVAPDEVPPVEDVLEVEEVLPVEDVPPVEEVLEVEEEPVEEVAPLLVGTVLPEVVEVP
jgi:disks large-associated protein 5